MEVAGQWRQQWAGTAEYGKVTEGGVTRRVARAMEVLHASGPGARVRVMRAAYHSTSAPGVPASSYMLHSSRRVISSGFNILESPNFPTKPLEISSTPLESSPESNIETENYKVTEPDDMDISEPSKWRGTTGGSSIRMPSEESSSTDNASIIDLDSRFNRKGLYRKYSYDSENSDILSLKRDSARTSPLLDAPVTLSTLKYKSLLNSSNDWNNRRKSYSFEDTSPLNEIILQSNDTLAMESSTDSGICKSSEIVNDFVEDTTKNDFIRKEKKYNIQDSIDNWQRKSKSYSTYKSAKMKTYNEHDTLIDDSHENNIALQSTGKLTITVPMTIEGEDGEYYKKSNDDGDRKVKKVGFCKTELHFAAESGRVNIIATDEKPPPQNDFRKRRSAFVPIKDKFEKPITLFGERSDFPDINKNNEYQSTRDLSETAEIDENTAATKSILKNKIPKPKPYLLGENMAFGNIRDTIQSPESSVSVGVSLINKELQTNRVSNNRQTLYSSVNETMEKSFTNSLRTKSKGPSPSSSIRNPNLNNERYSIITDPKSNSDEIKNKINALQMSPVPKPKTRQLRESDLTYFGLANHNDININKRTNRTEIINQSTLPWTDSSENTFESVRLIKKYSNSAQNSDAESDSHEYQNIPMKTNFAPVPIPRSRAKYMKPEEQGVTLKPIIEQVCDSNRNIHESRRSRSKKQDDIMTFTSRSLSAPAKNHMRNNSVETRHRFDNTRSSNVTKENTKQRKEVYTESRIRHVKTNNDIADDNPLYANVDERDSELNTVLNRKTCEIGNKNNRSLKDQKNPTNNPADKASDSLQKTQISKKVGHRVRRTEKLCTPEKSNFFSEKNKDSHKNKNALDNSTNNSGSMKDNQFKGRQQLSKNDQILKNNKDISQVKDMAISVPAKKADDSVRKPNDHTIKEKNIKDFEQAAANKNISQNSLEYRTMKANIEKNNSDRVNNSTNSRRSSRRSEYVIKYDDKNGTVSSICKVRSGHSTPRKKHVSKERNKEYTRDLKYKNTEKSALRNAAPCPSDTKRKK